MTPDDDVLHIELTVALDPSTTFDTILDELTLELARLRIRFVPGAEGCVIEGDGIVGRVTDWAPGARISLEWHPASWEQERVTTLDFGFEACKDGTRVTMEHRGFGKLLGDASESAGWLARGVVAPLIAAITPCGFGDWFTDRRARCPSGALARVTYRDPIYHRPNFCAMLERLALTPEDYLVEVGCGGGAFLFDALQSGCRAAAVDHSSEMVRLARELNCDAIAAGRLTVEEAPAERLPFADGTFTCGAMTGVFGFLADPLVALTELHRVLVGGGRLMVMTTDPRWRSTPAAPEPMASRLHFLADHEVEMLAQHIGFGDARVERIPLDAFAREVGVPKEAMQLFEGPGAPFLIARKT